jgi:GntR family L-lactate dehydrogenase operon transcriptional regulator
MLTEKERLELAVLSLMVGEFKPIGSGAVSQTLRTKGYTFSESTIGRLLAGLDHSGYTSRMGFQGRLITAQGQQRLAYLQFMEERSRYGFRFLNTLDSKEKKNMIEILVARRAVERELAGLAALYATKAQIRLLEDICHEHHKSSVGKKVSAEQDVKIHRLIAHCAGNAVLASALDLIIQNSQLSPIFEYIRNQVQSRVAEEHAKIYQAIADRNPEAADRAMLEHLESLIVNVEKYWEQAKDYRKPDHQRQID